MLVEVAGEEWQKSPRTDIKINISVITVGNAMFHVKQCSFSLKLMDKLLYHDELI